MMPTTLQKGQLLPFRSSTLAATALLIGMGICYVIIEKERFWSGRSPFASYSLGRWPENQNAASRFCINLNETGTDSPRPLQAVQSANSTGSYKAPDGVVLPPSIVFLKQKCSNHNDRPKETRPAVQKKLVLFYNRPNWMRANLRQYADVFQECKTHACVLTEDRGLVQTADAVLVFMCQVSKRHPPSLSRFPQQIWVAFCREAPPRDTNHHLPPTWWSLFNWTMTYRTDSDVFAPYGSLALRLKPSTKNYTHIATKKTKPVAWLVSHCETQSRREDYVRKLQKYIEVDIYGDCGPLKCPKRHDKDCLAMLNSTYYFYLAFENSLCRDYVSEKFFKLFSEDVNIIPVVRGGADYKRYIPPNIFINTADFASPQQLATHLKYLIANTDKYVTMMKERDNWLGERYTIKEVHCFLCNKLHNTNIQERAYPHIMDWVGRNMCWTPTDL